MVISAWDTAWHGLLILVFTDLFLPHTLSMNCSSVSDCLQLGGGPAVHCSAAGLCLCQQDWTLQQGSCVKVVRLNRHCKTDKECQAGQGDSYCSKLLNICQCRQGFLTLENRQKQPVSCEVSVVEDSDTFIDPTMIGILVILGLMFVVICVVLQMFSRAQFGETQTIFNTPNPRLMNVSMVKGGGFVNKASVEDTPTRSTKRRPKPAREDSEACDQV